MKRFFVKDGALRHYTQHFLIALLIFLIFRFFVFEKTTIIDVILFFLFSFLIDLDSVFTVLFSKKNIEFRKEIFKILNKGKIEEVMVYATKNHKKIDNLKIHNLLFYMIFAVILVISIVFNHVTLSYIFLALVTHMTFDILDDLKNLGHLKHWERIK